MHSREEIKRKYLDFIAGSNISFDDLALDIFQYQSQTNPVYKTFLNHLSVEESSVADIEQIPFLPVSMFKKYKVKSGNWKEEKIFESSSTSGIVTSKHFIRDLEFYLENAKIDFEESYGDLKDYCFMALLPSYLERNNSSLVFMVDYFIKKSGCGGFYKYDYDKLLMDAMSYDGNKRIVLIGVTFALLEMAVKNAGDLSNFIIMETGGMKGRGKELPRVELHGKLKQAFGVDKIHSEYGMTELLSQSYSKGNGVFKTSKTMKMLFSDIYDPFSYVDIGRQGKINVIDLANFDTCSFLATDDLGRNLGNGKFEVLGRTDESDIRGCNLLFTG